MSELSNPPEPIGGGDEGDDASQYQRLDPAIRSRSTSALRAPTEREQAYLRILDGEGETERFINIDELRTYASQGIPERLRPLYWRVLLNYLPPGPLSSWAGILSSSRQMYKDFLADLLSRPEERDERKPAPSLPSSSCTASSSFPESTSPATSTTTHAAAETSEEGGENQEGAEPSEQGDQPQEQKEEGTLVEEGGVIAEDHPLSDATTSRWHRYFKDKDMQAEIDKDVRRTFPHLHFFNQDGAAGETRHHQALRRILFIYAKLNPGINYVQGMNEVLGPIYYTFASDTHHPEDAENAEADAFFCFTNLMSEIMNHFCKTLDASDLGIRASILRLNQMLRRYDQALWQDCENKGLDPHFYSFRWITLLLSQEFELPDVIRLWDSLFADPLRFNFLLKVCCAMLISIRKQLLEGDFASNLKTLQAYPAPDIIALIRRAERLDQAPSPPNPQATPSSTTPSTSASLSSSSLSSSQTEHSPSPPFLSTPPTPPPDIFTQAFENLKNAFFS